MTHGSLFSGIGGFDLAAEWMGWTNVFNCEWENFPRQVLKHHFPNATQHKDIREFDATNYLGRIDIVSGGFPCQPFSTAGKRKGTDDERHLWPEMLRIVRECAPRYVVGENVRGLVNWSNGLVFETVQADLESAGYAVQPFVLPAAGVGAPHRRDRVWFVAYADNGRARRTPGQNACTCGGEGICKRHEVQFANKSTCVRRLSSDGRCNGLEHGTKRRSMDGIQEKNRSHAQTVAPIDWSGFPTQSAFCGRNDGFSPELDGITFSKWRRESIKAFGNAIVPQVAFQIFKAIEEFELSL